MRAITVARKPLAEVTVAANVLKHGTGALNIGASRISTAENLNGGAYSTGAEERHDGAENWRYKRGEQGGLAGVGFKQPPGRWPANLILGHLPDCVCAGTRQVKGSAWDCAPGCPVTTFDEQVAPSKSSGGRIGNKDGGHIYGGGKGLAGEFAAGDPGFGDTGGPSRYFKQVK